MRLVPVVGTSLPNDYKSFPLAIRFGEGSLERRQLQIKEAQ